MFVNRSEGCNPHHFRVCCECSLHKGGASKALSLCECDVIGRAAVSSEWYEAAVKARSRDYSRMLGFYFDKICTGLDFAFQSPQSCRISTNRGACAAGGNPGATSGPYNLKQNSAQLRPVANRP